MKKLFIDEINDLAKEDATQLVALAEKKYQDSLQQTAKKIVENGIKIVLISGPSSAGKTTSSYRLQRALSSLGVESHVLNMDNFFMDRFKLPFREDGEPNIEDICALDVDTIRKCLGEILQKNETKTPEFDFVTHTRKEKWVDCTLKGNEIIVMEGIHAHNPRIVEGLDIKKIFKIYLDCDSKIVIRDYETLSSKEIRLLRRMIRDERDRKVPYLESIEMWQEVCKGEDKNIKPFKPYADVVIDTLHSYELLLYKKAIESKIKKFDKDKTIAKFLKIFDFCDTIDESLVPKDSLLREFIGE